MTNQDTEDEDFGDFKDFDETESEYSILQGDIEDFSAERQFLQKFDRILASDTRISVNDINAVKDELNEMHIGFADLQNRGIYINFPQLYDMFEKKYPDFLKSLKGVNHHELAHLLFTIKPKSYTWSFSEKQHKIFNLMEDSRIETLFTELYPSTTDYFIWNISKFIALLPDELPKAFKNNFGKEAKIIADLRNVTLAYLLTYGRKFYNPEFSKKAKTMLLDIFKNAKSITTIASLTPATYEFDVKKCEELLDEFILTTDFKRQKELVLEMEKIIGHLFGDNIMQNIPNFYSFDSYTKGAEKNQVNKASKLIGSLSSDTKKKIDDFKNQMNQKGKGSGLSGKNDKDKEKNGMGAGSKEKSQKSEKSDGDKDKDKSNEQGKDKTNANGQDKDKSDEKYTILKELKADILIIIDDVNDKLKGEIERDIKQISDMKVAGQKGLEITNAPPYLIKTEDKLMSKRLVNIVRKLRQDLRQSYVKKLKSGHIDIRRVMQEANRQVESVEVFKKYRHSKIGKTKMAVSILIDSSGSMSNEQFNLALRSAYCIADCLEKVGSKSSIVSFDTKYIVMKKFNESIDKIKLKRGQGGGTEPYPALLYSESELEKLKKQYGINHLLVLMISDCWFSEGSLKGNTAHSLGGIFDKLKRKFKIVIFNIHPKAIKHTYEDILKGKSHFFYKIENFDELYFRMLDFIKKYEMTLHRDIAKGW